MSGDSAKIKTPTWDCTACGQQNPITSNQCTNCPCQKGQGVPTELPDSKPVHLNKGKTLKKKLRDYTVTGQPINPITGNVEGPTPPGHKAQRPVFAGVPKPRDDAEEVEDEDDEGELNDTEFKQLRKAQVESYSTAPASGDAVQRLMGLVRKHDNRKKSFHNLFGGPEHEYNGVS